MRMMTTRYTSHPMRLSFLNREAKSHRRTPTYAQPRSATIAQKTFTRWLRLVVNPLRAWLVRMVLGPPALSRDETAIDCVKCPLASDPTVLNMLLLNWLLKRDSCSCRQDALNVDATWLRGTAIAFWNALMGSRVLFSFTKAAA